MELDLEGRFELTDAREYWRVFLYVAKQGVDGDDFEAPVIGTMWVPDLHIIWSLPISDALQI